MSLLLERCPFPKRMTLPFIVQVGPSLQGAGRKRERERERGVFLAPLVGVVNSVSRDRQLRQLESLGVVTTHALCRRAAILFYSCAPCFVGRGRVCADKYGMAVTPHPQRYALSPVVMEACSPYRDDVAPRPFLRTSRWNSVPCCDSKDNKRDCNPHGGSGWPCTAS
jgi:hypothetical protein